MRHETKVSEASQTVLWDAADVEVIDGWQCIGCGRVEASRPCVGICQDRRARFVDLDDFLAAIDRMENAQAEAATLAAFVAQIASLRPREGHVESSFAAIQARARAIHIARQDRAPYSAAGAN